MIRTQDNRVINTIAAASGARGNVMRMHVQVEAANHALVREGIQSACSKVGVAVVNLATSICTGPRTKPRRMLAIREHVESRAAMFALTLDCGPALSLALIGRLVWGVVVGAISAALGAVVNRLCKGGPTTYLFTTLGAHYSDHSRPFICPLMSSVAGARAVFLILPVGAVAYSEHVATYRAG